MRRRTLSGLTIAACAFTLPAGIAPAATADGSGGGGDRGDR
ncbi:hypothetical protein OG524_23790 [Streptomyces sp. NBC_01520]